MQLETNYDHCTLNHFHIEAKANDLYFVEWKYCIFILISQIFFSDVPIEDKSALH